ncbi:DNA repair protein RecO [Marinobacter goseongensis]|jgi:DNA repair protein RecO (recombination protein O)|uniref:DNA repair protein RecO n=1 Tax=Marinobacter goseongensis TaxID=453838 RepID=UPI00200334F6|nr:DNA repair protein RecO [Marinobacter goseongensis]MCK7551207.1 DNA repair protein RecO [Marinobacter goseongensis]
MATAVQQEPAYVLHRRPWRETSLQVDVFSLNAGRMSLIARGANSARSPLKAQLQPFQPLLLDWTGRGDLKTLTQTEVRSGPVLRGTTPLYSGLYINELLQRILPAADPHPTLFAAYIDVLAELAGNDDVEPVLRRFERSFVEALGYSFAWDLARDTGAGVEPGQRYCYDPEQGIVQVPSQQVRLRNLPGDALLALAEGDFVSLECRRTAKRVMRVLVDYLLQGKPLHSRTLFSHGRKEPTERNQ